MVRSVMAYLHKMLSVAILQNIVAIVSECPSCFSVRSIKAQADSSDNAAYIPSGKSAQGVAQMSNIIQKLQQRDITIFCVVLMQI